MTEVTLKDITERSTILVASDDINVRPLFQNVGFKSIQVIRANPARIESILSDPTINIDALVIEDYLGGRVTSNFIREIRDQKIGDNPFLPIVAMLSEQTPHMVDQKMQSGVDDLLMKPLSSEKIQKRLLAVANRDLEWIVTKAYIGPNRRSIERTKKTDGLITVPNILRMRSLNDYKSLSNLTGIINHTVKRLKDKKLALESDVLSEMLKQAYVNPVKFDDRIERVKLVAWEYAERLKNSAHSPVADLCHLLIMVLNNTNELSMRGNHSVLMLLSQAIELSFDEDSETHKHIDSIVNIVHDRFKNGKLVAE
jgi:DNA-binding NarL/FixJ family response regulator